MDTDDDDKDGGVPGVEVGKQGRVMRVPLPRDCGYQLHAHRITVEHPSMEGRWMTFTADPPACLTLEISAPPTIPTTCPHSPYPPPKNQDLAPSHNRTLSRTSPAPTDTLMTPTAQQHSTNSSPQCNAPCSSPTPYPPPTPTTNKPFPPKTPHPNSKRPASPASPTRPTSAASATRQTSTPPPSSSKATASNPTEHASHSTLPKKRTPLQPLPRTTRRRRGDERHRPKNDRRPGTR